MASGFLSLEGIRGASEELSGVARALAQEQAVALIVGSDGALSFSPSVARAISEAHLPHPLQKTIARACERHRARTGSDCTQLLTLLGEALRLAARLAGELGDARARSTLLAELPLLEAALPDLFREVRATTSLAADPALFGERLAAVVRSRSESASGIVSEFVRRSVVPDWSASLTEALDYFVDRFEDVCSRAVTPVVDDSSVLEGFLLMSSDYCPPRSAAADLRFVVVWDVSVKTDDVIWTGCALLPSKIWSRIEAALSGLGDRGVSAILTPSAAPSRLRSCCSRLGITLVDRLSPGELRNISFFTEVVPLDTLSDSFEANCVLHVDSVRSVVFGSSRFLHLQTSSASARRPFRPCHVVLCAPSPAVWKERYSEFLDCLKVLRQWLMRPPGFVQDLSPVCGLSFPVGSWELELKLALPKKVGRSCPNACRVLDGALLAAACDAWGVPACRFRGSYREFAARSGDAKGVVPAATAESVVSEVLQLLRQLLRIDAVLGSREAIRSIVAKR